MEKEFKFAFTAKEVDVLAGGLGKLPLEISQVVFGKLVQQYQAQVQAQDQQPVQDVEAK